MYDLRCAPPASEGGSSTLRLLAFRERAVPRPMFPSGSVGIGFQPGNPVLDDGQQRGCLLLPLPGFSSVTGFVFGVKSISPDQGFLGTPLQPPGPPQDCECEQD